MLTSAPNPSDNPPDPALRPELSVTDAAGSMLHARFEAVSRACADLRANPHGVSETHLLRVSTRRATAALRVFKPHLDPALVAKAGRLLRKLRRSAGGVRACDVQQSILDAMSSDIPGTPSTGAPEAGVAAELIIGRIEKRREASRRKLAAACERWSPERIARLSEKLVTSLHLALNPMERLSGVAFTHALSPTRLGPCARAAVELAATRLWELDTPAPDFEGLHQLRLAGKRLRYVLELIGPCLNEEAADASVTTLRKFQDRLGDINDRHELAQRVERVSAKLGLRPGGKAARGFASLRARLLRDRDEGRADFALWWPHRRAKLFEAVEKLTGRAFVGPGEVPVPLAAPAGPAEPSAAGRAENVEAPVISLPGAQVELAPHAAAQPAPLNGAHAPQHAAAKSAGQREPGPQTVDSLSTEIDSAISAAERMLNSNSTGALA